MNSVGVLSVGDLLWLDIKLRGCYKKRVFKNEVEPVLHLLAAARDVGAVRSELSALRELLVLPARSKKSIAVIVGWYYAQALYSVSCWGRAREYVARTFPALVRIDDPLGMAMLDHLMAIDQLVSEKDIQKSLEYLCLADNRLQEATHADRLVVGDKIRAMQESIAGRLSIDVRAGDIVRPTFSDNELFLVKTVSLLDEGFECSSVDSVSDEETYISFREIDTVYRPLN